MHVTGRAKVAADDYEVCVIEVLDRLELYNDLVLHDEVETMATDLLLPEQDANELFSLKRDPAEPQLDAQSIGVNRLHETRSELTMHVNRSPDDVGLSALHAGDLPKSRSSRP